MERIKKNFQSLFKKYGLEVIIECNKKLIDYLDVTFNLKEGTYKPYHRPDNKIIYINVQSNHPPNIIKQLPKTIEQELSNNASNETRFNEAVTLYVKVLSEGGYDAKLKYNPNQKTKQRNKKKNRKRNIIWFNPPYIKRVITKFGHYFLKLLDKNFPRQDKLHNIFNKKTVNVSCSCTKNIKSIINSHNKRVLCQSQPCSNQGKCNCIKKELCSLNGNCQAENVVYEATITCNEQTYGKNI